MNGVVVASGRLPGFDYISIRHAGEILHKITVTGKIDLQRRLPLYHATLEINETSNYFCILDNREGHENILSLPHMKLLDDILIKGGIEDFYGVTVTTDASYRGIVKLASYSAEASKLKAELMATPDIAEAERFILQRMESVSG